jgi:glycosyltransferase involved in cell wall biosynthesis
MRVAHVHRIAGVGGSERHLLTLLPALRDRGVDACFVGLDVPGSDADAFYRELAATGVPAHRLRAGGDLSPLLVLRLRSLLRRLRPELVHTHLVHADVYGAVATTGIGARLVTTKHNDDPFRAGPFRLVERTLARRAAAVVTITDALRAFVVERVGLPAAQVRTIHYGLDEPPRAWRPDEVEPPPGRVLLCVGRLVEQKGYDVAVRALPTVRAAHPDAVLVLVGDGPLRGELAALAGRLGVADAVVFAGRSGDVGGWMRHAEALVHPARWEGFGLVVLEAMVHGLPVAAARASALPELVEDGVSGLLVPPDDPERLADALRRLLGDDAERRRLGAGAQERARTRFSVARMANATVELYSSIAAASTPAAQL